MAAGAPPLPSLIRICPVSLGVRCSRVHAADCADSIIKKGCVLPSQGMRTLRVCPPEGEASAGTGVSQAIILEVSDNLTWLPASQIYNANKSARLLHLCMGIQHRQRIWQNEPCGKFQYRLSAVSDIYSPLQYGSCMRTGRA